MKRCKNCGYIVKNNDMQCSYCGHSLNDGKFTYICDKCGRIFGDNDLFCPNCGVKKFSQANIKQTVKSESSKITIDKDKINETLKENFESISTLSSSAADKIKRLSNNLKDKFTAYKDTHGTTKFTINKKHVIIAAGVFIISTGLSAAFGYFIHDKEAVPSIEPNKIVEFTKVSAQKRMCSVIALNADIMETPTVFGKKLTTLPKFTEVEYIGDADSLNKGKIVTSRPLVYYKGWKRKKINLPAGTPLQLQGRNSNNGYDCAFNIGNEVVTGSFDYDQIIMEHTGRWRKVVYNNVTGYIKDNELSSAFLK